MSADVVLHPGESRNHCSAASENGSDQRVILERIQGSPAVYDQTGCLSAQSKK